eukprot:IDg14201t1
MGGYLSCCLPGGDQNADEEQNNYIEWVDPLTGYIVRHEFKHTSSSNSSIQSQGSNLFADSSYPVGVSSTIAAISSIPAASCTATPRNSIASSDTFPAAILFPVTTLAPVATLSSPVTLSPPVTPSLPSNLTTHKLLLIWCTRKDVIFS